MILLDLCAAFDTQDHNTLGEEKAPRWFSSHLKHRIFSFSIGEFSSSSALVSYGVHLGSSALQPVYAPTMRIIHSCTSPLDLGKTGWQITSSS